MEVVVATATSVLSPIGDTPEALFESLMAGRSAIGPWAKLHVPGLYSKIGGDLTAYAVQEAFDSLESLLPADVWMRSSKLMKRLPWSTRLTLLVALKSLARLNAEEIDWGRTSVIVGSSDISMNYDVEMLREFSAEPAFIDPLYAIHCLDTDHAAVIAEAFGILGSLHVVGGACASGNLALKQALDEIRHHEIDRVFVVSPVFDYSPLYLHSLALVGAIVTDRYDGEPRLASRPFDRDRCGFVPTHAAGCIVLESLRVAEACGHSPKMELLAAESTSDATHMPVPSVIGQKACLLKTLKAARVEPEQIQYVSLHATSTELGDLTEARSLREVFGKNLGRMKTNAAKSLLGHACGASALVELTGVIEQVRHGHFHASANIENLDAEIDFDVLATGPAKFEVEHFVKNSFGFGGINSCSVWKRWSQ
ncbi:MAG: beta-ketoacyl-[acyl-carrier-protein] synthase family protein [Bdellovibrionota bacterium]